MGTAGVSSALDTRLLRVLVAMAKHVLAAAPGSGASDVTTPDAKSSPQSPDGSVSQACDKPLPAVPTGSL
jgi:hypothetical protein